MTLKRVLAVLFSLLTVILVSCGGDDDNGANGDGCTIDGADCQLGCRDGLGCVQCLGDGDCGAGEPFCVLGHCRTCSSNADCGTGQACFPRDHTCHPACTAGSCPGDAPTCDPNSGQCVGCLASADCAGTNRPVCNPDRAQCSECASSEDCGAAQPACDLSEGECRECLVDSDCREGFQCNHEHECRSACQGDGDCKDSSHPFCNLDNNNCVECLGDPDCPATQPFCRDKQNCVQCITNAQCADAAAPFCKDDRCVQCAEHADCITQPNCTAGNCKCKGGQCSAG